ncbi:hypothetical protein EV356DRAFT_509683 [Viridothelium virens]|uniref:Rab proteins geranylgeranyltransferase n=1 Tax=Viridothelium virens TaxID=1048519 RepID=A0A6A6HJW1_VIRVR|nr:hypothetical protein EV356DRAFT_509683 [Viridothelium virens]
METLDGTSWDIVISGTGLQQSLLALALSRTEKKILHIDKNGFYGGSETALSLQEAQEWVEKIKNTPSRTFRNAASSGQTDQPSSGAHPALSFSRAYSLALAPQIIYSRSALLQFLVSSKVYRQLEFQAIGSWYIYSSRSSHEETSSPRGDARPSNAASEAGTLLKVPNGREDIFSAENIDLRAKRSLMNFLRFVADFENQNEQWDSYRARSLPDFLADQYNIPQELHEPLLALTLSPDASESTTTEYALPRIARHLRSIGVFGSGFGAVIPKWGGLAEIAQVGCRAGAVGGAVYVLGMGAQSISNVVDDSSNDTRSLQIRLSDGSVVRTGWLVGEEDNLPQDVEKSHERRTTERIATHVSRSISIVAASFSSLLPPVVENAPIPAGAVVVVPAGSLVSTDAEGTDSQHPPVHVIIHSSDTGECPDGQAILYASTSATGEKGVVLLKDAVDRILHCLEEQPAPTVLWSMQYEQMATTSPVVLSGEENTNTNTDGRVMLLAPVPLDLALDDRTLESVRSVWERIVGEENNGFMVFEDREGAGGDDGEEE